ncbi:PEP-CTERM motif protein [Roseimaritima multifibrata]|uniref:PEP-CTERM motif protein n=1 Tax=Roseimaritima multifibrata TaxID=1930274 RepID=A0A517MAB2_9BACT|nr:PEP-CTERM sorting domain-containing protein [Roseimaritima multifibrata]QDS91816.1 PEP-CTERM motif protein [Roseimaritima multifibrata]
MMRTIQLAVACVTVLIATAGQVQAGVILDFAGGSTMFGAGDYTVGFTFSVTAPVAVDGLAWWDEGGDGLNSPHEVGLWTGGGSLLASTFVSNGSTIEPSTSGFGNWLITDIATLNLGLGDYVIGGVQPNSTGGDLLRFPATATTISGIVFGVPIQHFGNGLTLTMPNFTGTGTGTTGIIGALGPNLRLSTAAVPEPSSLALFGIGACVACVGTARRRRREQKQLATT